MAGSLANLIVTLAADTTAFVTGMDRASKEGKRHFRDLERGARDMGKAIGVAAAAIGAGLTAVVGSAIKTADQMAELAKRTGLSTEALSQYKYAAELSGVSLEELTGGINKMQRSIADADKGVEKQVRAFNQLGLSIDQLMQMTPDQQFEAIAEAISKLESATLKSAAAQDIFSRGGAKFLSLMDQGAAGIRTLREEADRFGLTIGGEFAKQADEFSDNLVRFKSLLGGVGMQIAQVILPRMIEFTDQLLKNGDLMSSVRDFAKGLATVLETLGKVVALLAKNLELVGAALGAILAYKYITPFLFGLGGAAGAVAAGLGAMVVGLNIAASKWKEFADLAEPLDRSVQNLTGSVAMLTDSWIANAEASQIMAEQSRLRQGWIDAEIKKTEALNRLASKPLLGGGQTLEQLGELGFSADAAEVAALQKAIEDANKAQEDALKLLGELSDKLKDLQGSAKKGAASVSGFGQAVETAGDRLKKIKNTIDEANTILDITQEQTRKTGKSFAEMSEMSDRAAETVEGFIEEMDAADKEAEDFAKSLQSVLDALYPIQAEGRRFGEELAILTRAAQEGAITWQQYEEAVRLATKGFDAAVKGIRNTSDELDLLKIAIDEGTRILERTFSELFEGILNDSLDTWGAIESGFKSLMASLNQAAARGVVIQIQKAFGEGGGGLSDLDLNGKFGQELLAAIGSIIGLGSADTLFGQAGATLGQIFGKTLFAKIGTAFFPQLLGALGSWAGPIGTALGAILGSALGDLIGGLFERDLQFSLGGAGNARAPDAQRLRSPLADIFGIMGKGGAGSLSDPSTPLGQLANALSEFDKQMADILKQFTTEDQFQAIRDSLEGWIGTWGEGATAADVIASRFNVILSNFSADIQDFVRGAADFEEQLERFGVALSAGRLIRENPDIFSGRTAGELLNLVGAMRSGSETMQEAFNEFLTLLNRVVGIQKSLKDYADSDLLADFTALGLDLSLTDALARVNSELIDAVATFDGSADAFERIGILALAAREGEIRLLSEIDAIQKGINSNLDKLKADILGINAPEATGEQLFNRAQDLIGQITAGSTAQDVAGIQQQFDSLIRSIAPEDQAFMQNELVAIIELFRARANEVLNARRQETLDNAAAMREMIDGLLTRVGDPLDLIAASLEGQNIPEVMEDGLSQINATVATIGPQVANAIAQGLTNINVVVTVQDAGLVTQ